MPTHSLRLRLSCMMGVLLLAGACGGSEPVVESTTVSPDVNAFLREALADAPTFTYDDLVARLGAPVRVRVESMSGGPEDTDTLRTLIYHGLELTLHEGKAPSRVVHVALTDARYTSPEGLRVGYAEREVRSLLGPPTRQEPAQFIYQKEPPPRYVLVVFLEQEAVSRMEWRFAGE